MQMKCDPINGLLICLVRLCEEASPAMSLLDLYHTCGCLTSETPPPPLPLSRSPSKHAQPSFLSLPSHLLLVFTI